MFLFQQARLSHYGGGKSSSIEVETLLVSPPFWVQSLVMNSPPQSQTTILFFSLLFFRQRLVYSVHSTFLSVVFFLFLFFCLGLLHGWISFVLPAQNVLCMVESSQNGSECSPPLFFVSMSTCNVYVTYCV